MIQQIPITSYFTVQSLLPIANERFAWWYEQGVFWALYGDGQGRGIYADTYLIENVSRCLARGWYDTCNSERLYASGLYVGMIHGGNIMPGTHALRQEPTIMRLSSVLFASGYYAGRSEPSELSDVMFMRLLHMYAASYPLAPTLAYDLGVFVGILSLKLVPLPVLSV